MEQFASDRHRNVLSDSAMKEVNSVYAIFVFQFLSMQHRKTATLAFCFVITGMISALSQELPHLRFLNKDRKVSENALEILPTDLDNEILLVLKFDSINLPAKRPKDQSKVEYLKWKNHNEMVPKLNRELREAIKRYPFKYRIVSMNNYAYLLHKDAKYLLWINSFDAFTMGVEYGRGPVRTGFGANRTVLYTIHNVTQFGIIDLDGDKSYLIERNVPISQTINYSKLIQWLMRDVKRQFSRDKES